ncbi:MAG: hypothetical protein KJ754_15205, partial [Bacteroidetes bacterium]|nr:hypothetical protein [Bacteroidota bacterium]
TIPEHIQQILSDMIQKTWTYKKLSLSVKSRPTNGTFGFSDTQANAQKTKRAIFCNRSKKGKRTG